jgi:hypothetical protein
MPNGDSRERLSVERRNDFPKLLYFARSPNRSGLLVVLMLIQLFMWLIDVDRKKYPVC